MTYAAPGSIRARLRVRQMFKEGCYPNWILGHTSVGCLYEVVSYSFLTDRFTIRRWLDGKEPDYETVKALDYFRFHEWGAKENKTDIGWWVKIQENRGIKWSA